MVEWHQTADGWSALYMGYMARASTREEAARSLAGVLCEAGVRLPDELRGLEPAPSPEPTPGPRPDPDTDVVIPAGD